MQKCESPCSVRQTLRPAGKPCFPGEIRRRDAGDGGPALTVDSHLAHPPSRRRPGRQAHGEEKGKARDPSSGSRNDPTVTQGEAGAQEGADRGGLFRRPLLHRQTATPGLRDGKGCVSLTKIRPQRSVSQAHVWVF